MSFWGGVFGSSNKSNDLPSAGSSSTSATSQPRKQDEPIPTSMDAPPTPGPPPKAVAYIHSPQPTTIPQLRATTTLQTSSSSPAPPPPKFQIFQPKPEKEEIVSNNETEASQIVEAPSETSSEGNTSLEGEKVGLEEEHDGVEEENEEVQSVQEEHDFVEEEQNAINEGLNVVQEEIDYTDESFDWDDEVNDDDYDEIDGVVDNDVGEDDLENSDDLNGQLQVKTDYFHDDHEYESNEDYPEEDTLDQEQTETSTSIVVTSENDDMPSTPSILKRFAFLDKESMHKLEDGATRRRHEFHRRLYEIDCNLGGLEARVADESMDCDVALQPVMVNISQQLERVSDRFLGNKLIFDSEKSQILEFSRRISALHVKMVHHKHETMGDLLDQHFESVQSELDHSIRPSLKMEASKADKREGTLFHKFESLAGTAARRFFEESATRKAAEILLHEQLNSNPFERDLKFLESLRNTREQLKAEREARRERDAQILRDVHETGKALKRAVLVAAGDASGR